MSSEEIAISVRNLTKTYRLFGHPGDRIKQFLSFGLKRYHNEFTALKDVSFDIRKGETVGIIGRNGSGKSTLLQVICGILKPTSGTVQVNGRVSALLELGAGFNPEFTGRENVYFQGALMGLSKEKMDQRFDKIAAFADIGEFIDQPVRVYSSGMFVRLAFAISAHVDAEIMVIDEALSVGDVFFQQKCMRYLRTFQNKGGTILFVSHDTSAVVGLCGIAILLSCDGEAHLIAGGAKEICQIYVRELYSCRTTDGAYDKQKINQETTYQDFTQRKNDEVRIFLMGTEQPENSIGVTGFRHDAESFGCGSARIVDAWFEDETRSRISSINGGSQVCFFIKARFMKDLKWPVFGFTIKDNLGQYVISESTDLALRQHALTAYNGDTWLVKFIFLMPILIQGEYSINLAVAEGVGDDHIQHQWIEDVMTLRSMKSRLVNGICGLQNLEIRIEVLSGNMVASQ